MQEYKERKDSVCMRVYKRARHKVCPILPPFSPFLAPERRQGTVWIELSSQSLGWAHLSWCQTLGSLWQANAVTPDTDFLPQALLWAAAVSAHWFCVLLIHRMVQIMGLLHKTPSFPPTGTSHCDHYSCGKLKLMSSVLCARGRLWFLKFQ